MALESGTYIKDLVSTNPSGTDAISQGDNHLRLIKSTIQASFPSNTDAPTVPDISGNGDKFLQVNSGATATEWTTYRADVRETSNDKEAEIAALADMDAVKAYQNHPVVETRKVAEYDDDGNESYGDETEEHNRDVDKTTFGWPTAPDAEEDPAFVSIVDA